MMMGRNIYYAPEGVPAGTTDGSVGANAPESENGTGSAAPTPAWMAQLPNDLKDNEGLAQYKTLGDAIKGLMGNKTEPAKQETKKEPAKFENFSKKFDTSVDPFGNLSEMTVKYMEGKGMSQEEAEEFFDAMSDNYKVAQKEMIEKGREYCEKAVKAQWGNEYESKRNLMSKGYQALGDTDGSLQKALDESGASLAPAVWELLSRIGALVSEDNGSPVRGTGGAGKKLPDGVPIDYSTPSA